MNLPEPDDFDLDGCPMRKYLDTPESAQRMLEGIDARIAWLAARGLRPHPTVIARRAEYALKANPKISTACNQG